MAAENYAEPEIAQALMSEYLFLACVDLDKDEILSFSIAEENTKIYQDIIKVGTSYSAALQMFAYRIINSEDVVPMLHVGSVEHVREMLLKRKAFDKKFLSTDNHYYSLKFLKVNGKDEYPDRVVIGLADKDEEIRDELEVEEKRHRNLAIIEVLASEYDATFYVDLLQNRCVNYSLNDRLNKLFLDNISKDDLFTKKLDSYISMFVFPDDREAVIRATSIYNISSELSDKKSFMLEYRSVSNGEPRYCEMRFVKVGGDETPKDIVWAVADKDKGIRARIQKDEKAGGERE